MALSRRSFLGQALVSAPLGLAGRPAAATACEAQGQVWTVEASSLRGVGPAILLSAPFDLVAVSWAGAARPALRLRVRRAGAWSAWVPAGASGHGPDAATPGPRTFGEPVWAGGADAVQLRAGAALRAVRLHLVTARAPAASTAAATGSRYLPATYRAGPGQPQIIARHVWANAACRPRAHPVFGDVRLAFVHHTENANGYSRSQSAAMVQAICLFHKYGRGWNDIGYNFLVDRFGQIFEGRQGGIDEAVCGAQAGGYNLVSTGVAMLGDFVGASPSAAALRALEQILAWKLALHGVPAAGTIDVTVNSAGAQYSRYPAGATVALERVSGHRDADSTDCPGDGLYRRLPVVRTRVQSLAGRIGSLTLTQLPNQPPPGSPPGAAVTAPATSSGPLFVGGVLSLAGEDPTAAAEPIAGATIAVEVRDRIRLREIATATTAGDGSWSAQIVTPHDIVVRAVFAGAGANPAVISPHLKVSVKGP